VLTKAILEIIQDKERHKRVRQALDLRKLTPICNELIKLTDKYYKTFPTHDCIDTQTIIALYASENPKAVESQILQVGDTFNGLTKDVEPEAIQGLMRSLQELAYTTDVQQVVYEFTEGDDIDVFGELNALRQRYERDLKQSVDIEFCNAPIEDLLEEELHGTKFNWRMECLQQSMPNMRTGDQIIVAGRPGIGKTSFIADNVTYMARQCPDGRPIVWFSNEGKKNKIRKTCYRAGLNTTIADMVKYGGDMCRRGWLKKVGPLDAIRIFDIHGLNNTQLEEIIREHKPCIVVWDMLDNVKGFAAESRTDLRLEELYKWGRESAVIYDFLSLPTSQISAEGAGLMWVPDHMLKDGKTGKQGACDGIIMLGHSLKPGDENVRGIFIAKTKYTPIGDAREDCKTAVTFDPRRARYNE